MKKKNPAAYRKRRQMRMRRRLSGTAERPRMCVYVSNKNLYVQFIDDEAAATLASVSTLGEGGKNVDAAAEIGRQAAEAAKAKGIEHVVFDRAGFRYGQRLKALADAAREAGLDF